MSVPLGMHTSPSDLAHEVSLLFSNGSSDSEQPTLLLSRGILLAAIGAPNKTVVFYTARCCHGDGHKE